ncbi:carbohydrate-binding protein, partial [Mycobacterium tuberculosis]|uniref:carbohydrate-binding protein n=1 Tax=Mycobacterium tuberculosis TaxID=1773 RepID=UPI0012660E50
IEAENFSSQSGLQTESCNDTGGGLNIGYIQNGDYAVYVGLDFGNGAYDFSVRVASATGGGTIEIRLDSVDGPLVGTCVVPGTGGWQNWTTVNASVNGASGSHDLYLRFTGGNADLMNVNWFQFIPVPTSAFSPIEAENFSSQSGLETENCSDTGGGLNIG